MKETDQDIIGRIAAGDQRGYAVLLSRYRARVMTLALRMLGHAEEAEEAAQDAFVRAFRSLHRFERRAQFSTWLYRITYNVCLTQLARRRRLIPTLDDSAEIETAPADGNPQTELVTQESQAAVARAIALLRPEFAAVITLFYLHEQSHEEIVAITGLPLGTVKNRLHRARNDLRRILRRQNRPSPLPQTWA